MRLNSLIVLPALAVAFSGCIYYESDGEYGCYDGDCAGADGPVEVDVTLDFSPDHVEAGSQFIGYITAEDRHMEIPPP